MSEVCRKELSKWLKKHHYWNRDRLANLFGISKKTIYNWTSGSTPIPKKHAEEIAKLMANEPTFQNTIPGEITLEVTMAQYDQFQEAAAIMGMTLEQWITFVAERHAAITVKVQDEIVREQTLFQKLAPADV